MRSKFYFLLIILTACRPGGQGTNLEKFKSVDSSLKTNTDSLQFSRKRVFDTSGKVLATAFDSALYQVFILRKKLEKADPSLQRMDIADSLLINSSDGHQLYLGMKKINGLNREKTEINNPANDFSIGEAAWLNRYFHNIPTIGAITILSKFQDDIGKTNMVYDKKIEREN